MIFNFLKRHKNFSLLCFLIVAIALTYWFEERGNRNEALLVSQTTDILNTSSIGDLKALKGLKIDFVNEGGDYFANGNHLALSKARIDELFKILSGLKVKKFISPQDVSKVGRAFYIGDDELKMTFIFSKGSLSFTLGKKLPYDQTFYMEIVRDGLSQVAIVSDESPDPGVYQNDKEYQRSEAKYKRLQMVFMLTNVYFYDTRLFKDLYQDESSLHFSELTISTFRNKKFTLSFKDTSTNPPAPNGIQYFEENWLSFYKSLAHLEAKTAIAPYEISALSDILSQFEIKDRDGRVITLNIYKKFGELNGYFLTSTLDKVLYVLKPDDARLFFVNVQDFWKKTLSPKGSDYQLGISFYDDISQKVRIIDKELFKVESTVPKMHPRPLEFKKLVDFLKAEGDHVSELTEKPSEILKKKILSLSFDNRLLNVILEDNDVVLVDLDSKLKIHHYVGMKIPFSLKRSDYFE